MENDRSAQRQRAVRITSRTESVAATGGSIIDVDPFEQVMVDRPQPPKAGVFVRLNMVAGVPDKIDNLPIVLKSLTDATEEDMSCVDHSGFLFPPDGSQFPPDGSQCEPSSIASGQSASMVLSVTIAGTRPGTMSAKVCFSNGTTCKTLSVAVLQSVRFPLTLFRGNV